MAVFRIEKTRDYTVMANYHLRDKSLSLKAKGLLSLMLSLPDDWDYTTKGLAHICKDGVDSICATVRELEQHGYIRRRRIRNGKGQLGEIEYTTLEQPEPPAGGPQPKRENPVLDKPVLGSPEQVKPEQENPAQLNTKQSSKETSIPDGSNTHSIPFFPDGAAAGPPEAKRKETTVSEMERYREVIRENIDYDLLLQEKPYDEDRLDEIVELLVETVCSNRKQIRVGGSDFPAEVVKSRLLKLDAEHIRFVFDCLGQNTTKVRNIRQYLLTTLYNAPATIGNYYSALVNHDMYGSSE